jgi:hypothetical protein
MGAGVYYNATNGLRDPNLSRWMFAQRHGQPEVPFEKVAKPTDTQTVSAQNNKLPNS